VTTRTWEVIQSSGEAPTGCFGHCAALDERRGRVLVLGQAGLFGLSLETWVWERLGQAKVPWYLPHLRPYPAPANHFFVEMPKGFTASVLQERLVVVGGVIGGNGKISGNRLGTVKCYQGPYTGHTPSHQDRLARVINRHAQGTRLVCSPSRLVRQSQCDPLSPCT
jgi:hypothetical protein